MKRHSLLPRRNAAHPIERDGELTGDPEYPFRCVCGCNRWFRTELAARRSLASKGLEFDPVAEKLREWGIIQ